MDDNDLVMQNIFGEAPKEEVQEEVQEVETQEEQPVTDTEQPETDTEQPVTDTEKPAEQQDAEPEKVEPQVDLSKIDDNKFIELINSKFNAKFDTIEAATDFYSNQVNYRGQEEIIKQLTSKLKENNVLSHFPNETFYKVATLAKTEFPGKEATLSKVLGAEVDKMDDFEAIRYAEELKRPANSRVNALTYKLAGLGLRDMDVSDFESWEQADKEILWGAAEDAKAYLGTLGDKVKLPEAGEDDFVSQIESGFQAKQAERQKLVDTYTPVAESIVKSTVQIKPVDGDDFTYDVQLDKDSQSDLVEFLTEEAIEGNYNILADADIKRLTGALHTEIWATDGPKIMSAYGKHVTQKVWDEARAKYENATPLNEETPPTQTGSKVTDNDYADRLIRGF